MLNKIKEIWGKTNRWHRMLSAFVILHAGLLPSARLGFYCNDPALSHPYTGDTISLRSLFGSAIFLPLIIMTIFERLYHRVTTEGGRKNYFLKWYKEYLYSLLIDLNFIAILKISVGEPRPHFFDTCRPTEALTCKESEYVPSYTCTQTSWVSQSAKSFPSGHSSLGVHCGLFIAWYLHRRMTKTTDKRSSLVTFVQAASVGLGVFCAVSRIMDNRHHWWDVATGIVIGVLIFLYTVYLCDNFETPKMAKIVTRGDEENSSSPPLLESATAKVDL